MKYNCGYILNKVIEGLDDLTEYYHWDGDDEIFQLEELINTMPMTKIGTKYGVSDNAVKKWARSYGIELKDMRGFWAKKKI